MLESNIFSYLPLVSLTIGLVFRKYLLSEASPGEQRWCIEWHDAAAAAAAATHHQLFVAGIWDKQQDGVNREPVIKTVSVRTGENFYEVS